MENAPEEERMCYVTEACKLANAHDFIEKLPEVNNINTYIFRLDCNGD